MANDPVAERELTDYECAPHQLETGAWYYHILGDNIEIIINLREYVTRHDTNTTIMLKVPLKPILKAEAKDGK